MREAKNRRDVRASGKHRGSSVSHQARPSRRQPSHGADAGERPGRQDPRHRAAAVEEQSRAAGSLGGERDCGPERRRQRSRQSERALVLRVIGSVLAFDRKLCNSTVNRRKHQGLAMRTGVGAVAEKSGEDHLAAVAHLLAANTQHRDLVPLIGLLARLHHAGEFAVRIKEERIAAVRYGRNERDVFIEVRDRIGVALEGGRTIATERLGIERRQYAMAGDGVGVANKDIPARLDIGVLGLRLGAEDYASIGHHRGHADFSYDAASWRSHPDFGDQHGNAVAVAGIDRLRVVHLQVGAVSVERQRNRMRAWRSQKENRERSYQRPEIKHLFPRPYQQREFEIPTILILIGPDLAQCMKTAQVGADVVYENSMTCGKYKATVKVSRGRAM